MTGEPDIPPAAPGSEEAARVEAALAASRAAAQGSGSKAGRNLPAAIGSGVGLGVLIISSLFVYRQSFLVVVSIAAAIAVWEMIQALAVAKVRVPVLPTLVGGVSLLPVAYFGGGRALMLAFGLACIAVLLWRLVDGVAGAVADVSGGILTVAYVGLLAAFCMMMLAPADGHWRVFVFMLVTVCSDIGGYVAGVLFGKHPMAPSVSPKKSWEGFAGSALTCALAGALTVSLILHASWWIGVLLGVGTAAAATVGDFCESVLKRDIGIKDMGHIIPGHGGILDRIDSLLLCAPMAWLVLTYLLPLPR